MQHATATATATATAIGSGGEQTITITSSDVARQPVRMPTNTHTAAKVRSSSYR